MLTAQTCVCSHHPILPQKKSEFLPVYFCCCKMGLFHRYKSRLYAEYNVSCNNDLQTIYIVVTLLDIREFNVEINQ